MERVAFCNTGSEAVMAAMRVARTVTGRDKIAMFAGAYHGIFDEVLVRAARWTAQPARHADRPGHPAEHGGEHHGARLRRARLRWTIIRARGDELAAVLVEPVQSRRPELQPREFLREAAGDHRGIRHRAGLRRGGHRIPRRIPAGCQALSGVRADLATYGKVVGGGLPIGIVAGGAKYMDALDGGAWRYGDDSVPGGRGHVLRRHVRAPPAGAGGRARRARRISRAQGARSCSAA